MGWQEVGNRYELVQTLHHACVGMSHLRDGRGEHIHDRDANVSEARLTGASGLAGARPELLQPLLLTVLVPDCNRVVWRLDVDKQGGKEQILRLSRTLCRRAATWVWWESRGCRRGGVLLCFSLSFLACPQSWSLGFE